MNFGLLCDDPAAAPVVAAFQTLNKHALTRAVLVSPQADELLHGLAGVRCTNHWEDLLTDARLQGVIVGGSSPEVWEGAKQFASAGVPLLVFPTVAGGATALYELSLIRDDQRGILFPAWLHRFDSAVIDLRRTLSTENAPKITYVHWEREVPLGMGREVPQSLIEESLLADADLWRFLFGPADQVTALRTGSTPTGAVIQSVTLAGRTVPELTWSIKASSLAKSQLTIHTDQGSRTFDCDSKPAAGDSGNAARLINAFAAAIAGTATSDWTDVLHAAEIVDAAQRSLTRRRTIELHHETLSERAIFKTQMAAMGCGVLMLTLLLMLGYLAFASVVPLDGRLLQWLRLAIFAPLFVYLLMQFLLPLTRTSTRSAE